jgi:hypothetical protein
VLVPPGLRPGRWVGEVAVLLEQDGDLEEVENAGC